MKKAFGFIFAFLALAEVIAIYPLAIGILESASVSEEAPIPGMTLVGLGIAIGFLMVFVLASVWCFRTSRQIKDGRDTAA